MDPDPQIGLYLTNKQLDFFQNSNLCFDKCSIRQHYINNKTYSMKYRKCCETLICNDCGKSSPFKSGNHCNCGGKLIQNGKDCEKSFYQLQCSDQTILFVTKQHSHNRTPPFHRVPQKNLREIDEEVQNKILSSNLPK